MLSENLLAALNRQITAELQASHLYLAMAAHFEHIDLPGFESWMRGQSDEERGHAHRIFDFVLDRDGRVELGDIDAPPAGYGTALETMQTTLEHERGISVQINELYELALAENDYPPRSCSIGSSPSRSKKRKSPTTSSSAYSSPATTAPGCYSSIRRWLPAESPLPNRSAVDPV